MITIEGNVILGIWTANGRLLEVRKMKNRLVNTGKQEIRDLLGGTGFRPTHMQIGTGIGATTDSMVQLQASKVTKIIDRRVRLQFAVEFQSLVETSEGNNNEMAEVGTFRDSVMLARALIQPTITKTSSIQITMSHIFIVAGV
jgi:hypothetical protein